MFQEFLILWPPLMAHASTHGARMAHAWRAQDAWAKSLVQKGRKVWQFRKQIFGGNLSQSKIKCRIDKKNIFRPLYLLCMAGTFSKTFAGTKSDCWFWRPDGHYGQNANNWDFEHEEIGVPSCMLVLLKNNPRKQILKSSFHETLERQRRNIKKLYHLVELIAIAYCNWKRG